MEVVNYWSKQMWWFIETNQRHKTSIYKSKRVYYILGFHQFDPLGSTVEG